MTSVAAEQEGQQKERERGDCMEETHRQKRWVGEGGPGGRAFSVITPALQWDGEGDKMRELWALPMLSDEIEKKKKSKV